MIKYIAYTNHVSLNYILNFLEYLLAGASLHIMQCAVLMGATVKGSGHDTDNYSGAKGMIAYGHFSD